MTNQLDETMAFRIWAIKILRRSGEVEELNWIGNWMTSTCVSWPHFAQVLTQSSSSSRHRCGSFSSCYNTTRRLSLAHLGAAVTFWADVGAPLRTLLKSDGNVREAALASEIAEEEDDDGDLGEWVRSDKRRMLHAVYNVGNLNNTIKFYTECLGMKLLRRRDIPEDGYGNAFLGYGPEESNFTVELTENYGVDKYNIGDGFGYFGISVQDVARTVEVVKLNGGIVTKEPEPSNDGSGMIAFIEDPNGYLFKLLESSPTPEPLSRVMLRVGDLNRSIGFYEKAYGMELYRQKDSPDLQYSAALMGYGPEGRNPAVELVYNYGITEYDKGNGYTQIAIGTNNVYKTAKAVSLHGGKIVREPGPLPVLNSQYQNHSLFGP